VCLSLIAQIAEQIDYLRFMPPRTPENARKVVDSGDSGRARLGRLRRAQAGDRAVPGVYIIANGHRRGRDREPAGAPVPGDLQDIMPAGWRWPWR
jgi:hypothetical protein